MTTTTEDEKRPTNAYVIETVQKLVDWLKGDKSTKTSAPRLSHYREIPHDVQTAYDLLHQGASLVHSTATKYTLVGKIDSIEQKKLGSDLIRGCELIGAATHVFLQDGSGCAQGVRQSVVRANIAIFLSVIGLVEAFEKKTALDTNIGAQKTGVVWESCDTIINKLLPQGNRNAIRRDLFQWTRECQDSMDEFQELVDLGPAETGAGDNVEDEEDDFFGDEEQYSAEEFPIAKACLGLLKCSRGTMKVTLETCEDLGAKASESQDEQFLVSILKLYCYSRFVGEGVTDLGSLMYPGMLPETRELEKQLHEQAQCIMELQDFVLGMDRLPKKVSELSTILRVAAETRQKEFREAIAEAKR